MTSPGEDAAVLHVSVLLPLMDETTSLRKTVEILLGENRPVIAEILIIACDRTSAASLQAVEELCREHSALIQLRMQKRPFLGGAFRDAFEWASGSHVLMMASDLETDPSTVKDLIAKARDGWDIVTATRWKGGKFHDYQGLKYVLNWIFQKTFAIVYETELSDLTFGFRIFRTELVQSIAWEEVRHPFLLETILKPLRLGAKVTEIPTTWRARSEGVSHNSFFRNFEYFRVALKTRFRSRQQLLTRS